MFKKIIVPFMLSTLTVTAFAGGTDYAGKNNNNTFINLNFGTPLLIGHMEANYDAGASGNQDFSSDLFSSGLLIGLQLGHEWWFNNSNAFSTLAGFNFNFSQMENIWHIEDINTPSGESFDLLNKVRTKGQYNILFGLTHSFSTNFLAHINAGPSILNIKNSLSITENAQNAGNDAAPGQSKNYYLWGADLAIGFSFPLSQHSAITGNLDYYVYINKNVNSIDDIDIGGNDGLSSRKLVMMMPTVTIGYSIFF